MCDIITDIYKTDFIIQIFTVFFQIAVVVATVGLLALGITGTVLIEQEFDPLWFISEDSYANDYFDADDKYFPSDGFASGHVYIGMLVTKF